MSIIVITIDTIVHTVEEVERTCLCPQQGRYVLCRLLWPQLWPIHQFPIFCFAARGPVVAVVAEQTCRRCLAVFGTETTEKVQDSSYQCFLLESAY